MNLLTIFICLSFAYASTAETGALGIIENVFKQCQKKDLMKCFKVQILKIADRALHAPLIELTEGVKIVSETNDTDSLEKTRSLQELEGMNSTEIDQLLVNKMTCFLSTRRLQVNIPPSVEGREKKRKYTGLILAALAIKGFFLSTAYKGIAVISGAAILIGKMALLLTALLGLKKLISDGGHEHTNFEIVKHPHYSHSYGHSSSQHDELGEEGYYQRHLGSHEEMVMQDKFYNSAYRAHAPGN